MAKISLKKGFGPVSAIVILAIVVIIGLVVYSNKDRIEDSDTDNATTTDSMSDDANATSSDSGEGSLRTLFSMSGEKVCTFSSKDSTSESSGTVYIADSMIRGDFTVKSGTTAPIESHMITKGDVVYAWTGNQGAKMSVDSMMQSQTTANSSDVDFNQDVEYECESWNKDTSKFNVPTTVNFIDVAAMMNAAVQ